MKNAFLKKMVRLIARFIRKHSDHNRILIVTTTALGDTLWATAAIENIKRQYPQSYLGVLTSTIGMHVLKNNPHIDKLFEMKEPLAKSFFSLRKQLYKEAFGTVLFFHASQRLTLPLSSLIGAERIIGTAGINKGLDSLLTHPLPKEKEHEIVRRLNIAKTIGVEPKIETLSLFLKEEEALPPRTEGPWIALHPGSKDPFKRWPLENFIALGKLLKAKKQCEILITGGRSEWDLMREVATKIPGAHIDQPDRPLREFAALLKQMDLLVSNDTGPVHLACALNQPLIAIYASTDPAICGPHLAKRAHVISRRATCEPCLQRKCRLPFCFMQISPEEVLHAIQENLPDLSFPS